MNEAADGGRWPVAGLDDVRRLRVLASATPGAGYAETRLAVPFERVWDFVGDVERSMPSLITDFRSFRVIAETGARHGEGDGDTQRFTARAVGLLGQRGRFEVELRSGWCLMQSRFVIGGFAAVPDGDETLFAGCGGLRVPGTRAVSKAVGGHGIRHTFEKLRRELDTRR
jgi:hypothetical protein